jgi:hypothetical protein
VKYIRTKTGGMKVVRPGDPDWEDAWAMITGV